MLSWLQLAALALSLRRSVRASVCTEGQIETDKSSFRALLGRLGDFWVLMQAWPHMIVLACRGCSSNAPAPVRKADFTPGFFSQRDGTILLVLGHRRLISSPAERPAFAIKA